MKKILLSLLTIILLSQSGISQTSKSFKYQAIMRNTDGEVMVQQVASVKIGILLNNETGDLIYEEEHEVTTNNFGLFTLNISNGSVNIGTFSEIDWANHSYYLKTEVALGESTDYELLGVAPLLSVPFAMHSETVTNADDADADPANEIQDLQLDGHTLTITKNGSAYEVDLSQYLDNTDTTLTEAEVVDIVSNNGFQLIANDADTNITNEIQQLSIAGETISLSKNGGNVTIPTKGWGNPITDQALFAVVNTLGDTVFAVYNGGVRIYVSETGVKAARGGFAVASRSAAKGTINDIFNVTNDSVRIYLDESTGTGKAARGGFAVASRSAAKGTINDIFNVTNDSVRIYLDESTGTGKAARGGFAVASRSAAKGYKDIMRVSGDSIRMYIDESNNKAARGGFAVASRSAAKGTSNFLDLTPENYFIGHGAGKSITTGWHNSFIGYEAGKNATNADYNTFIGYNSGFSDTSGSQNVFIGPHTGYSNSRGVANVFIGYRTGYSNLTGYTNVFMGADAGYSNTEGYENVFIGTFAGYSNTTGHNNSFFGTRAGHYNTEGLYNCFFGKQSGHRNTIGEDNCFYGHQSGRSNTTGNMNVYIGGYSGCTNISGYGNVGLGSASGYSNTTGNYNLSLGQDAGWSNETGSENVYIGVSSGFNNITGSNNIFLGSYAGTNETNSNRLYIENSNADSTNALIYGEFDNDSLWFNADVKIKNSLHVTGNARIEGDIYYGTGNDTYNKPDFVFNINYKNNYNILDIESFIHKNKHLPWLTSVKDEIDGINLTRMSFETLEAVENQQLQIINLKKENVKQQEIINELIKRLDKLENK